ncbi:MAG: LPS-assembly protein LptD [Oceanospirillaceae bacterium]|nr:LPS-assembly protein LptD [Oceanospirillaceae bacterium]MCP5335764.1 LPS-assembly protein LptD [Oceanospirillaceae bacterium]MCP5349916.1 LPS-assembly protein LptD [Oceanospirillaceae bacterium]
MRQIWYFSLLLTGTPLAHAVTNAYASLDWVERSQLPPERQAQLPSFCSGDYVASPIVAPAGEAMDISANTADMQVDQDVVFNGNIELTQTDKLIRAEHALYNQQTEKANFKGDVSLRTQGIVVLADTLDYAAQNGTADVHNAQYAITDRHIRGEAQSIRIKEAGVAHLDDATYTFCEPGHNDWDIKASEIWLDQNEGYGEAMHTRLRIFEIPVLYFPYYRFPIGDQRLTGFLNPTIGMNIEADSTGVQVFNVQEFAAPFYLNIAPNYDDTITPHYLRDHGVLMENEFRYLNLLGTGSITGTYLGHDWSSDRIDETSGEPEAPEERWSLAMRHNGQISRHWQDRISYDEVSDTQFTDDFKSAGSVNRSSHLKQNAEVEYNDGDWQFLTRAESYQTVDETISDSAKPFRRLPQIIFKRLASYERNQLVYDYGLEATRFERSNDNLTGVSAMTGKRLHSHAKVSYPLSNSYSFLTPSVEVMHTEYSFADVDAVALSTGYETNVTRNASISSLNGGLYFEREFSLFGQNYVQTLEPRAMYAYIPYVDQSMIPLFDTTESSFSYSQLFRPNRFTGIDRVGDTEQLSTGVSTRFINQQGLEVLRLSAGQIQYYADRKVRLAPGEVTSLSEAAQLHNSAYAGEIEWRFADDWRFSGDMQFNPHIKAVSADERAAGYSDEKIEKASAQLHYQTERAAILDVSFTHVEASKRKQVGLGFFAPLTDSWAIFGQQKKDIWPYRDAATRAALRDENRYIIEGLGGLEYQNCCWRVQATYQERTLSDATKDYQFMMQFHLKGLGIFGRNTDDIIRERVNGYDQRVIHDY